MVQARPGGDLTAQDSIERFFRRLMELRPVEASYHGLHEFDGRLPEGSLAAAQEEMALIGGLESELAGADAGTETEVTRYYAALARFQAEEIRLWSRMPDAPDLIGSGLFLLFARDFAPLEERLQSIASRLEAVPEYLRNSRERLTDPVELWVQIAADTAGELPALYSSLVSAAPEGSLKRRLELAAAGASEATENYARWLLEDALRRARPDWALGPASFERLITLRRLPDSPQAIRALGERYLAQFKEERAQLLAEHWPGRTLEEVNQIVRSEHAESFEAALQEYRQVIAAARSFVAEAGLATIPADEELRVEPTPRFLRPVIPFAAYEPPARFDTHQLGIYIVTPQEDGLGEHNHSAILNTSVHEAYPGHHLQLSSANQHPSLARLLAAEYATELVEGWAHYCEQLMYDQGFAEGPELRFVQLNDLIWRACRIVLDVDLSCGRLGVPEGVATLVREAAMDPAAALAEVRRYTYTPGYQLSYLYGRHLLGELRERRRQAEGPAFQLRPFHDRLLYAGSLPSAFWNDLFVSPSPLRGG
ncbi:MAG: DUF885 domain-containing protein [Candidatus Dormibacteraeota bacterium]|nr:DUF885 domain-containing protein [Candidatus Dormibacteraeota bacterium]